MPADTPGPSLRPPCDECRRSKIRCDRQTPTCSPCRGRVLECTYTNLHAGRTRRFHRRSKSGCQGCRSRKVRCDGGEPVCGRCQRTARQCIYDAPDLDRRASPRPGDIIDALVANAAHSDTLKVGSLDPDPLAAHFPTLEERLQFRHVIFETVRSLVITPTPPEYNPWLTYLTPLAIGEPAGRDLCHDAFRSSLLCLGTVDMGIKLARPVGRDAMYSISTLKRTQALDQMRVAVDIGLHREGGADILLAGVIALTTRDRLYGESDWERPLELTRRILADLDGADGYLASPTPLRRFLVEQLAAIDLLSCLVVFKRPQVGGVENRWLASDGGPNDHLHLVYGWDRPSLCYALQGATLASEFARLDQVRSAYRTSSSVMKGAVSQQVDKCKRRIHDFLETSQSVRLDTLTTPLPSPVMLRSLCLQSCMDLCLYTMVGHLPSDDRVERRVTAIYEAADESVTRGEHAGLLFFLTWAIGTASARSRDKIQNLLETLVPHYHLDPTVLRRLVQVDWTEFNGMALGDWEEFLKRKQLFYPIW